MTKVGGAMGAAPTTQQAPRTGLAGAAGVPPAAHAHGGGEAHAPELALSADGDPRFLKGSVGPVAAKEGDATTIKGTAVERGEGFDGRKGQNVNGNDRKQMNYSVTDANFNPRLGLLPAHPDTGEELNYTQHVNTYNMAGSLAYLPQMLRAAGDTTRADLIQSMHGKMVANQNAGRGTVLGAAGAAYGVFSKQDPALEGVTPQELAALRSVDTIPGTRVNLRQYVISSKDVTGQNWARMHHPESAWEMMAKLQPFVQQGRITGDQMLVLSGDDAVSGSGRLNGVNNQDGKDSFNAGEIEVWSLGAQLLGTEGIGVMMAGHNHNDQPADAMTDPKINKLLGLDPKDRTANPERVAKITQALVDGTVGSAEKAKKGGTKADDRYLVGGASGGGATEGGGAKAAPAPQQAPVQAPTSAPAPAVGGGAGAPTGPAGSGGCADSAIAGAASLGGGPRATATAPGDMAAILSQLVAALSALVAALQGGDATGAAGGGPAQASPAVTGAATQSATPAPPAQVAVQGGGAAAAPATDGHAHAH